LIGEHYAYMLNFPNFLAFVIKIAISPCLLVQKRQIKSDRNVRSKAKDLSTSQIYVIM